MRHALALAVVALASLTSGCTGEAGVTCPPGQTLCGTTCVYTTQDPMNCGACGNVCTGDTVCIGGQCGCPKGLTACGGKCVDLKSDATNCGMCGTACPAAQVCSMSACADNCGTGLTNCSRNCVDLQTDDRNCGMCGTACGTSEKCTGGACVPECPTGQTLCSNKCVVTNNDTQNCGACGNVCPNDFFCVFGVCILGCPQPLTRCIPDGGASDGGSQCVDTRFDPNNCGGCGGADVSPRPSPDPALRPHVCEVSPDRHTNPVCDDGRCAATCENGFYDCRSSSFGPASVPNYTPGPAPEGRPQPSTPADLFCFDFTNDPCNCGGCLNRAPGWLPGFDENTGANSICIDNGLQGIGSTQGLCCDSQATWIAQPFSCGSSCADVVPCPSSAPSCCHDVAGGDRAHTCIDTQNDVKNCGACGEGQYNGELQNGDCTQAPTQPGASPFPACCGAGCHDLNSDTANCGACNNDCNAVLPSTSPLCCPAPGGTPGVVAGTCVDGNTDLHNCGSCGHDCTVICPSPAPSSPPIACFGGGCCSCEPCAF